MCDETEMGIIMDFDIALAFRCVNQAGISLSSNKF